MQKALKIKGKRVTRAQKQVHDVLKQFGPLPDHALVPLAQHVTKVRQSSSGIRTRRSELLALGLVKNAGEMVTASGRKAVVYKAVR